MTGRGRKTRHRGELVNELETHLERYHALLAASGQAFVAKIPAPLQPVGGPVPGQPHRVVCERRARVAVDYQGHDSGGRHVAVEAKMASGPRLPLSTLRDHQLAILETAEKCGAHAWIVVMRKIDTHRRAFYRVPPSYWGAAVRARMAGEDGAMASFSWAELDARGYRFAGGPHWLDGEMRAPSPGPLFESGGDE